MGGEQQQTVDQANGKQTQDDQHKVATGDPTPAADPNDANADAKAVAAKADEPPPAWQHPDYDGPLNGEQAMWRNANIKRLDAGHDTKVAKQPSAKK